MANVQNILVAQWYEPKVWGWILWPFSKLFYGIVRLRQYLYQRGWLKSYKAEVPVIVVGNLTVGGTGKTPLVIGFVDLLLQQGLRPGVVLRGYKSNAKGAIVVQANMPPKLVGDEAIMLAKRCACPVVVAKKRAKGVQKLIKDFAVNIIVCDDGLQHYALQRDIEIAVVDGDRGFGNGQALPMGPLRELPDRLSKVDLTIVNGKDMYLACDTPYSLLNPQCKKSIDEFAGQTVHAIAGIGTPDKFFKLLEQYNITVIPHAFADHHEFKMTDLSFADYLPILMTEKDAVKCGSFASRRHWVIPVRTIVSESVRVKFNQLVQGVIRGR